MRRGCVFRHSETAGTVKQLKPPMKHLKPPFRFSPVSAASLSFLFALVSRPTDRTIRSLLVINPPSLTPPHRNSQAPKALPNTLAKTGKIKQLPPGSALWYLCKVRKVRVRDEPPERGYIEGEGCFPHTSCSVAPVCTHERAACTAAKKPNAAFMYSTPRVPSHAISPTLPARCIGAKNRNRRGPASRKEAAESS